MYNMPTEEVVGQGGVHLPDGGAGVAVIPVLLAVARRLPDDSLHLLKLGEVHVAVAVQVEHAKRDLKLPPETKKEKHLVHIASTYYY